MNKTTSKLKAKSPSQAQPSRPKILIFGSWGTSKTWGALSFPNAFFIDTEGGANIPEYTERLLNSGGQYMGPEDGANDLEEIINQMAALATEKNGFKTLIIDSITKPYQTEILAESVRLEKANKKNEFSVDKKPANALMKRMVGWLDKLDMNVIFIAREKSKWASAEQVGYTADIWQDLNYELNLVLRIYKVGNARMASVDKTRIKSFPDGDVFVWSETAEVTDTTALNEFIRRMGTGIMDESRPSKLSTSEQVGEIERLLGKVKVPESEVSKILETAKAESWYEVTAEQADATIKWLNNKLK